MDVVNEIFYHTHRENYFTDQWKIGSTITFGQEENYFFSCLKREADRIILDSRPRSFYDVNRDFYNKYYDFNPFQLPDENKDYAITTFVSQYQWTLDKFSDLNEYLIKHRQVLFETVFENVRKQTYQDLPSRIRGLWVHDSDDGSWRELFGDRRMIVFKVALTGRIHKADGAIIVPDLISVNDFESAAHKYWQGEISASSDQRMIEYLFEGKVQVLDIVS